MLPSVIRWLGLGDDGRAEHRREQRGRACGAQRGDPRVAAASRTDRRASAISARRSSSSSTRATITASGSFRTISTTGSKPCGCGNDLRLELIAAERDFLHQLLRDGKITDELRRRLERDLDLEEAAILARREGMTPL